MYADDNEDWFMYRLPPLPYSWVHYSLATVIPWGHLISLGYFGADPGAGPEYNYWTAAYPRSGGEGGNPVRVMFCPSQRSESYCIMNAAGKASYSVRLMYYKPGGGSGRCPYRYDDFPSPVALAHDVFRYGGDSHLYEGVNAVFSDTSVEWRPYKDNVQPVFGADGAAWNYYLRDYVDRW